MKGSGHEAAHEQISRGEIDVEDARQRLLERYSPEEIEAIIQLYASAYGDSGLTAEEVLEEIVCDAMGRMNAFATDATERVAGEVGVFLRNVRKAAKNTGATKNTTGDGGMKRSIEMDALGRKYVQATRQVIEGNDPAKWGKQIENYINQEIRKGEDVLLPTDDGHILLLTERSAYKLSDRHKQDVKTKVRDLLSDYEYEVKSRMAAHIDELVQVGKFQKYRSDYEGKHKNDIGEDGFNYYNAFFKDIDGQYYRVPITAGMNGNNETVYSIGEIRKRRDGTNRGSSSNGGAQKNGTVPSGDIIVYSVGESQVQNSMKEAFEKAKQGKEDKGKYSREMDTQYMSAVESGDMQTARRMVEQAAEAAGYNRLFYHGAKKGGGFTKFRDWQYFTENRAYAERYTQREKPGSLYTVFAKMENPFDTRNPEAMEVFEEARQELGLGEIQDTGLPDWTDGYDLADYIDENDLDYDGIVLDEGGDLVNGKPVSRGLSYVIRKSAQVKSAETVTYGDEGNIIPLSERFRPDNTDIRYSREMDTVKALERQNKLLQEQRDYWKDQTRMTKTEKADKDAVRKLGREILREYSSSIKVDEILTDLQWLADDAIGKGNASFQELTDAAEKIARKVLEGSGVDVNGDLAEIRQALKQYLRSTPINITESIKAGIPDFADFKKRNRALHFREDGSGTNVDEMWLELQDQFGTGMFPEEVAGYFTTPHQSRSVLFLFSGKPLSAAGRPLCLHRPDAFCGRRPGRDRSLFRGQIRRQSGRPPERKAGTSVPDSRTASAANRLPWGRNPVQLSDPGHPPWQAATNPPGRRFGRTGDRSSSGWNSGLPACWGAYEAPPCCRHIGSLFFRRSIWIGTIFPGEFPLPRDPAREAFRCRSEWRPACRSHGRGRTA